MKKHFDIVSEDLFVNNKVSELNKLFTELDINTVFIVRTIKCREDLIKNFNLPKLKSKVVYKKAYLFKEISLINNFKENELVLLEGGDAKRNTEVVNNKKTRILFNPIYDKLSFDEQNARVSKQNNIKITFNINQFRDRSKLKVIKQTIFIINILKQHKVDMLFCSMAKEVNQLIDPLVLESFLLGFDLHDTTIKRFLNKDILK